MVQGYQASATFALIVLCSAFTIGNCDFLDLIENLEHNTPNSSYLLFSKSLPDDTSFTPTLGNGHVGFTVFGDSIYVNGIYNGKQGLSHRARIPNFANFSIVPFDVVDARNISYSMNLKTGVFQIRTETSNFQTIQLIYPHRYYTRTIINEMFFYLKNGKVSVSFDLTQSPGKDSPDFDFIPISNISQFTGDTDQIDFEIDSNFPEVINVKRGRAIYKKRSTESINKKLSDNRISIQRGFTREIENAEFQKSKRTVCIASNMFPKRITLNNTTPYTSFRFAMSIDENCNVVKDEILTVLEESSSSLLNSHSKQWKEFWTNFNITVTSNISLSQTINAGIFYIASSLPSQNSYQPNSPFYGISPGGLGRGSILADYQGHNFWDTEIWMLPPITQMNPEWTRNLLNYRFRLLDVAKYNAKINGLKGSKFPWESAYTGTETTEPCCPEVAEYQIHITGDISFAAQHYFSLTHDTKWLREEGCALAENIAEFWASRVKLNNATKKYDIPNVMGPDEDHYNITNSAYTNVIAGYSLKFGEFARTICDTNVYPYITPAKWTDIAHNLELLYDSKLDYHPEYNGYTPNITIKQADVILLGYPLQFPMNKTTRINDLRIYENVTRTSGPAMTWSMHAINNLDVGNKKKADELFVKGYKNYVRAPFMVWSETVIGVPGFVNFLTGIGGFLQTLINGYGGVRVHIDHMEVKKGITPPDAGNFTISGIKYLGSSFEINAFTNNVSMITCTFLNRQEPLTLTDGLNEIEVSKDLRYEIRSEKIKFMPRNSVGHF